MAEGANVQSIEVVAEMRAGLLRFSDEARRALLAAAQELARTEEWLRERLNYWQREVERREEMARRAVRTLEACRSNLICDEFGHCWPPPCARESQYYEEAVRFYRVGQAELDNTRQWTKRLQQAAGEYQVAAGRLTQLTDKGVLQATTFLSNVVERLYEYTTTALPGTSITAATKDGDTTSSRGTLEQLVGQTTPVVRAMRRDFPMWVLMKPGAPPIPWWPLHRNVLDAEVDSDIKHYLIVNLDSGRFYPWQKWGRKDNVIRFGVSTRWAIFNQKWKKDRWILLYSEQRGKP